MGRIPIAITEHLVQDPAVTNRAFLGRTARYRSRIDETIDIEAIVIRDADAQTPN